ncbi:MAG: hypothetical protein CMN31_20910 [Sandaracinus sp.]|nr:hypothetical protein [Myxococcales bacterium]MAT24501.1 hypothetical protein [Sandaracinus sp.]MBJ73749.1 hypothetical protein [Sandaracinus sp.]
MSGERRREQGERPAGLPAGHLVSQRTQEEAPREQLADHVGRPHLRPSSARPGEQHQHLEPDRAERDIERPREQRVHPDLS